MTRMINNLASKILGLVMVLGLAVMACYAQEGKAGGRLAGTWDAVVTLRNCGTGAPINTFRSIANFNQGGTYLGSTSGLPQAARTPEHGVWRHISSNLYEFKFKSFNFDPTGVAVSYTVVHHVIELNDTADAYTSAGEARIYLLNGTQVGQGCSDAIGTRFDF